MTLCYIEIWIFLVFLYVCDFEIEWLLIMVAIDIILFVPGRSIWGDCTQNTAVWVGLYILPTNFPHKISIS